MKEVTVRIQGIDQKGYMNDKGRVFTKCPTCMKVVCVNKPVFGSLHICDESESE